jgi:hypothetical protein
LSVLTTTSRWRWSEPVPVHQQRPVVLPGDLGGKAAHDFGQATGIGARGLAAACALRSLAAATICLALVIFWVDLTELIRPLSSFSEATQFSPFVTPANAGVPIH